MFNLGFPELVVIFTLALLLFGPRKLPEIGRSLGKSLNEFKKATNDLKKTWETEVVAEEQDLRRTLSEQRADFEDISGD
jgi:sec-independent protein translocase protein TatA